MVSRKSLLHYFAFVSWPTSHAHGEWMVRRAGHFFLASGLHMQGNTKRRARQGSAEMASRALAAGSWAVSMATSRKHGAWSMEHYCSTTLYAQCEGDAMRPLCLCPLSMNERAHVSLTLGKQSLRQESRLRETARNHTVKKGKRKKEKEKHGTEDQARRIQSTQALWRCRIRW